MECAKCGGPLDASHGGAFAVCAYCDHSQRVRGAETIAAEAASFAAKSQTEREPTKGPATDEIRTADASSYPHRLAGPLFMLAFFLYLFWDAIVH